MKCYPALTLDSDLPFWVSRDVFDRDFDQEDFRHRNQEQIERNHSKHWFYFNEEGRRFFLLPTVNLISGRTQFINGRHRSAVLLELLDTIPIAFVSGEAVDFAKAQGLKPVSISTMLELPDFPIVERPEY